MHKTKEIMVQAIKLFLISDKTLLVSRKSKISFLRLVLKVSTEIIEAYQSFIEADFSKFDAQVGENSCQIRAHKICFLAKDKHFFKKIKSTLKIQKNLSLKVQNCLNKYVMLSEMHSHYNSILDKKENALQFLIDNELHFDFDQDRRFLILSYFLKKYCLNNFDGYPSSINYYQIKNSLGISLTQAKNIVNVYQNLLSYLSCMYVVQLETSKNRKNLLKALMSNVDNNRYMISYYEVTKTLVCEDVGKEFLIVLLITRQVGILREKIKLLFKYCKNSRRYQLQSKTNFVDSDQPCLVFSGVSVANDLSETCSDYLDKISSIGVENLILYNAATHPQYIGDNSSKGDFYKNFIQNSQNVVQSLTELESDFDRTIKTAFWVGCSKDNPTLICIKHIYCDNISNCMSTNYNWSRGVFSMPKLLYREQIVTKNQLSEQASGVKEYFENMISVLPGHIYWKNLNGEYLGCNRLYAVNAGLQSSEQIVGLTDKDLVWSDYAGHIYKTEEQVIKTGYPEVFEEKFSIIGGVLTMWLSRKEPLRDSSGAIIGIVCVSINITDKKVLDDKLKKLEADSIEKKAETISQHRLDEVKESYERILALVPGHVYWKDINGKFMGCNNLQATDAGYKSPEEMIGLDDTMMPWSEDAKAIRAADIEVMNSGKSIVVEERSVIADGSERFWLSRKDPLYNLHGEIIGIIGSSHDITDKKQKEAMIIEMEQQAKFNQAVTQVAHDIRSPVAALSNLLRNQNDLPQDLRVMLNSIEDKITSIANNLVNSYSNENPDKAVEDEAVVLSVLLTSDVIQKRYEYQKNPSIAIDLDIADNARFVCANIDPTDFSRMVSNLLNNSIEAFKNHQGRIKLSLSTNEQSVTLSISDNGCGMTEEVRTKLINGIGVTDGKEQGHGIGFIQIRETLKKYNAHFDIQSKLGQGTTIMIDFHKIKLPATVIEQIHVSGDDVVLVVDDDISIHDSWNERLKSIPAGQIKHFTTQNQFIEFISQTKDRSNYILITDYEISRDGLNGLDLIEQSQIDRRILVTSHSRNLTVTARAKSLNTPILPKELLPWFEVDYSGQILQDGLKQVDAVILEDDPLLLYSTYRDIVFKGQNVDLYESPTEFIQHMKQYPKNTKIFLDNTYKGYNIDGYEIAKNLHDQGFTNYYLLTGKVFFGNEKIPSYLSGRIVSKLDYDRVNKLAHAKLN